MRAVEYDMAYIFRYSPREGTRSAMHFADDVPEEVKHERNQLLLEELERSATAHNKAAVGSVVPVMVEGPSPRNKTRWFGRSDLNKMVHFEPADGIAVGDIVDFRITRATGNALYGERSC